MGLLLAVLLQALGDRAQQMPELSVELVGNAGVVLTDGVTSLLIDLPYQPGAFGYMVYDPTALRPPGSVVSVITHEHRDHFDPALLVQRVEWRLIGPPSVTRDLTASSRVLAGDSVTVGAFSIVALRTPHTDDHRSYRVRWRGRVLFFTGDTEDAAAIPVEPRIDVLFVTPWLNCTLARSGRSRGWDRSVLYHRRPDGSDEVCGSAEPLAQGSRFSLVARV